MIKNLSVFILMALLLPIMTNAQNKAVHKAPIKFDKQYEYSKATRHSTSGYTAPETAASWIEIDTMANTFGPASPTLNPVAFDPVSGVAAVVHRGDPATYAAGSGELWWNYSTDMGMTWVRSTTSVQDQFTTQILARYPSMTIVNPTGSTDLADLWGSFAWPELNSSFEWLGYGVSIGMMESAFAAIDQTPPAYSSNVPVFTDNQYVYWVSDFSVSGNAALRLFRTADYTTIDISDPPQWASPVFQDNGNIAMGGVAYNGKVYYGVIGSFYDPTTDTTHANGWFPGYSVSTDNGSTWSDFNIADWREVPTLANYDELWDWKKGDTFISYAGDINVDKDGMVHIVVGLTHYTDTTEYGENAIVELYETSQNPSVWDGKVILGNLTDSSLYVGPEINTYNYDPAVAQSGESPFIATNGDRDFFAAQWVYKSPDDSACDVYMSYRYLDPDSSWSAPVNLTETPGMNENDAHLAPMLAKTVDGSITTYTAFSMYCYETGFTGKYPDPTVETSVFMAAVPIHQEEAVGINNDVNTEFSYQLDQNYPNPFNPTTQIKYTLAEKSNVTLKVFDMLGREVTTLVNGTQSAGTHSIDFNASNLASGLYIYKIQAGNFTQSKKMMLLK
jgi:hypothetical protein